MVEVLAANPVLTVFLVIAAGSLFGLIPFGPIRFGPAGALFVGLALGALDPRLASVWSWAPSTPAWRRSGAGPHDRAGAARLHRRPGRRTDADPHIPSAGADDARVGGGARPRRRVVAVVAGGLLGIGGGFLSGRVRRGRDEHTHARRGHPGGRHPAPGRGIRNDLPHRSRVGHPRHLPGDDPKRQDTEGQAVRGRGRTDQLTIVVGRGAPLTDVPSAAAGLVRFCFWQHDGSVDVAGQREVVEPGDRIAVIGPADAVTDAVTWLGRRAHTHLAHDRTYVDYRRVLLSRPELSGRSIAELDIAGRFGGIVTRVRRGDLDLLAREDLHVQLGDRLRVVVPRGRMPELAGYFGDTERKISEVDALSPGLGLSLGFLLGLLSLPLGSINLSLGVAAGPLIVGIFLGWWERTGPIVWSLPTGASATLRQLGILLFLAGVGLSSGPAPAASIAQPVDWKPLLLGVVLTVVGTGLLTLPSTGWA